MVWRCIVLLVASCLLLFPWLVTGRLDALPLPRNVPALFDAAVASLLWPWRPPALAPGIAHGWIRLASLAAMAVALVWRSKEKPG